MLFGFSPSGVPIRLPVGRQVALFGTKFFKNLGGKNVSKG